MAKGMNKRKETKKPKKEATQAKVATVGSKPAVAVVPASRQKE